VIFLSPDAEEPLLELDEGAVYVIGGLVDYGRIRTASLTRARDLGAAAARLPLAEFAERLGGRLSCEVLALNQVFIALLEARSSGLDWAHAFACAVPLRKLRTAGGRNRAREKVVGSEWKAQLEVGDRQGATEATEAANENHDAEDDRPEVASIG